VPHTSRLTPLTVGFHETMFLEQANGENAQLMQLGPAFRWNGQQKQELGTTAGPATPQNLNRFAYGLNNPQRYVDPSGHSTLEVRLNEKEAEAFVSWILGAEGELGLADMLDMIGKGLLAASALTTFLTALFALLPGGQIHALIAGIVTAALALSSMNNIFTASTLRDVARQVQDELTAGSERISIRVKSEWWGDRIIVNGKNPNPAIPSERGINSAGLIMRGWMLSGKHNSGVTQTVWGVTWTVWRPNGTLAFP
jgi:hypothetical protein